MSNAIDRTLADAGEVDFSDVALKGALLAVAPGEVLLKEFMRPLGLSAANLARDLGLDANDLTEIIKGERSITAATALRLATRFGGAAEFWMTLQMAHDLEVARRKNGAKKVPRIDDLFGIAKGANPEGYRDRKDRY
jgi:addiction module HigA family antidote